MLCQEPIGAIMGSGGRPFGKRVLQARLNLAAREGRTVSQSEIAGELGVHQKTVATWEHGKKQPDLDTIARLAEVLGTSPAFLAFGIPEIPHIGTANEHEKPSGKGKP